MYLSDLESSALAMTLTPSPMKKGEILQHLSFLCIAQRTEIASALVLNFLLFQQGAQTTDVVQQNNLRPHFTVSCIIFGFDVNEPMELLHSKMLLQCLLPVWLL